tara:strand:+ start:38361 stop:38585 length:225 start_codon:yes stop_codon:yes gene_type:complete
MNGKYVLLSGLFLLGVVDQIHGDYITAEITTSENEIIQEDFNLRVFPCALKEGDFFYFLYIDGVTEIRCGEPQE